MVLVLVLVLALVLVVLVLMLVLLSAWCLLWMLARSPKAILHLPKPLWGG